MEKEVEVKKDDDKTEVKMKIKHDRDNDRWIAVDNDRQYILRGDATADLSEGEFYVSGRAVEGGYYEVQRVRPLQSHEVRYEQREEVRQEPVVRERRVIEERPVVREREVIRESDPPVFKLGPLEIND